MKKTILTLIVLLTLPSLALAIKPVKPPPVDYQALIDAETDARIAADADLQSQIDENASGIVDNAAQIQANTDAINTSIGGVKVYDNEGQYLGLLSDISVMVTIYIPSLKRGMRIHPVMGLPDNKNGLNFTEQDCNGQAYAEYQEQYRIFLNNGSYYTGTDNAVLSGVDIQSVRDSTGYCYNLTVIQNIKNLVLVQEVSLPFTMPVALPLQFE